jgi:hypothetical protein
MDLIGSPLVNGVDPSPTKIISHRFHLTRDH